MRIGGRHFGVLALLCALVASGCGGAAKPPTITGVSSPNSLRVVAVGDIACAPFDTTSATQCQQARTAALAKRLDPELVLTLGDHQYNENSLVDYRASYALTWGALRSITHPTIGNHEYLTPGATGYYDYFRGRQPGPPGYYRVTNGGWNIYLLNSNCDKVSCAAQATWLRRQMATHPSKCSMVTMHAARYSSGTEHGDNRAVRGLWDAAYDHRNDVVLAGHDHDYERFRPMDAFGHQKPRRGMTSFVVGTGGKSLYQLGPRRAGSAYAQDRTYGVLLLDLRLGSYSWSYRSVSGAQLDAGSRSCR